MTRYQFPDGVGYVVAGSRQPNPTPAPQTKTAQTDNTVYAVGVTWNAVPTSCASGKRDPRWRDGVISRVQVINGVTWYTIPAANGFPFMYTADNGLPIVVRPIVHTARRLA